MSSTKKDLSFTNLAFDNNGRPQPAGHGSVTSSDMSSTSVKVETARTSRGVSLVYTMEEDQVGLLSPSTNHRIRKCVGLVVIMLVVIGVPVGLALVNKVERTWATAEAIPTLPHRPSGHHRHNWRHVHPALAPPPTITHGVGAPSAGHRPPSAIGSGSGPGPVPLPGAPDPLALGPGGAPLPGPPGPPATTHPAPGNRPQRPPVPAPDEAGGMAGGN